MNINAAIIDQRLTAIASDIQDRARDELNIAGEKLKSIAFVYLCVKTVLDLSEDEAFDCLTEGGGDFGVDALHLSEEKDGEFTVSLFQAKYKASLEGNANFPEEGINALVNAIRHIFDPSSELGNINDRLKAKVEEVRSLIRDGYIPQIRALACNNGLPWNQAAQGGIQRAGFGNQVTWEHVNHDRLVSILQAPRQVSDSLQFSGKAMVEDFNFSRVFVGRIAVIEIAALIQRHGERLLERNIRRYLGLQGNRVNEEIQRTLLGSESGNFYFYNNGITLTCDKFSYNALQKEDYQVKIQNLQIINGGQTCMTIFKSLQKLGEMGNDALPQDAFVLVRLYQLPSDNEDLVKQITFATNSQNPVDLKDLRANDERQRRLETDISQLGYVYRRKRVETSAKPTEITSGMAAEAILSVWRKKPHQAKFFSREHFGRLYDSIFTPDLNGAQVVIAVLFYRIAENRRKKPLPTDRQLIRYASCFISMQMGKYLLRDLKQTDCAGLSHRNFNQAKDLVDSLGDGYFGRAVTDIEWALYRLYRNSVLIFDKSTKQAKVVRQTEYGDKPPETLSLSLQQLSATFRRGDLIEILEQLD